MIRSNYNIEYSKIARYEPRGTGRTTKMIKELPSFDEYEGTLYLVGLNTAHGTMLVNLARKLKGEEVASRCIGLGSQQAFDQLRGVDPFAVFIDHAALEYSELRDIKFLYSILDMQNSLLTF